MKRVAYIVGTNHKFQFCDPEIDASRHQIFSETLSGLISDNGISGLAEECNIQALNEQKCQASSVQILAVNRELPHRYCDPDRDARDKRGILQENAIRASAFMKDETEDQIQEMIKKSYLKRESYWADELLNFNVWPVLFVCGANHVKSFVSVLDQHGVKGIVCNEDLDL